METPKDTNDLKVDHNRTERDTDHYQERGGQGREEGQWVPKYIKMGGMHASVLYHRTVSVVSRLLSSLTESRKRVHKASPCREIIKTRADGKVGFF